MSKIRSNLNDYFATLTLNDQSPRPRLLEKWDLFNCGENLFSKLEAGPSGMDYTTLTNFQYRLIARLVSFGMYFAMNFTAAGIKYFLKNSNEAATKNLTGQFSQFLLFTIADQRATSSDSLFDDFEDHESARLKAAGDKTRRVSLPVSRGYRKMWGEMARYERLVILDFLHDCSSFFESQPENVYIATVLLHINHVLQEEFKITDV